MTNYILIILNGLRNGALLALVVTALVVCSPCLLGALFIYLGDRRQSKIIKQNLVTSLIKKKYDKSTFTFEKQCGICMGEYSEDEEVTPLPCDPRHYFHTECIEHWFLQKNTCPYCNKFIT